MDLVSQTNSPHSPVVKPFGGSSNALSQLQPSQIRMLRDGFQILDRDSDGSVGREDVVDMLGQLGNAILNIACLPKPDLCADSS